MTTYPEIINFWFEKIEPESWWKKDKEEKYTPLHKFNGDMVFVDSQLAVFSVVCFYRTFDI